MSNGRRITLMRPSQVFDSFMDEFFNTPSSMGLNSSSQLDMYEDEGNLYIEIKAPGFKKEDIEISLEGDMLTVFGKNSFEEELSNESRNYYIKEIKNEEFRRTVALPVKIDPNKSDAKVKDGIVKITLPKLPESRPQKISISMD